MIGDDIQVPDLVESIRAVRCWKVVSGNLYSINDTYWDPAKPLQAYCKGSSPLWYYQLEEEEHIGHDCPGPAGSHGKHGAADAPACGIYGFKDLSYGLKQFPDTGLLWGEVELWGRHFTHEHGYRAEFARPVLFYERYSRDATIAAKHLR